MYHNWQSSRANLYTQARKFDQGNICPINAAAVLLHATSSCKSEIDDAISCLGGHGYSSKCPISSFYADSKLYDIGGGTNEIKQKLIGKMLLKETRLEIK